MKELAFSFFDCTPVPQGPQTSVSSDLSDRSDQSDYTFIEQAVRRFRGWITVTAELVRRTIVRCICSRFRAVCRMTGVQILRKYAILRI